MRSRQTGMTAIGFVLVAAMVGVMGYAGLKLTPIYLENMKVRQVMADVKSELDGNNPSPQLIRRAIDKRINIEMIQGMTARDFEIEKSGGGFMVAARYERYAPLLANVSLVAEFDEEVEITQ